MTVQAMHKKAGLILDTNLLVLYIVGIHDSERIELFKRTRAYSIDDFELLVNVINYFGGFTTTPNVLTEVSNLIEGFNYNNIPLLNTLGSSEIGLLDEHYVESKRVMDEDYDKAFTKFGLSDAVLYSLARRNYLILTDDLDLCAYLQNKQLSALNFNNLRTDSLLG